MKNLNPFINYLLEENISQEEGKNLISGTGNLSSEEKNIVYKYCYPRILLDRELPTWIKGYREYYGKSLVGSLTPDFGEVSLLIEAFRTQQYKRFMVHLMHAFTTDSSKISPISGENIDECPICGKKIYELDAWKNTYGSEKDPGEEFLCLGSHDSKTNLCKNCLAQLLAAVDILSDIENFKRYI